MFPSSDYLKDTAAYAKSNNELFNFVPYKNKGHFMLANHNLGLEKTLKRIGMEALALANAGKTNFEIVLFDHTPILIFDGDFVLTSKSKKALYKKFNKIVIRKSEIIISVLSRFGHNVALEAIGDLNEDKSCKTLVKFDLED